MHMHVIHAWHSLMHTTHMNTYHVYTYTCSCIPYTHAVVWIFLGKCGYTSFPRKDSKDKSERVPPEACLVNPWVYCSELQDSGQPQHGKAHLIMGNDPQKLIAGAPAQLEVSSTEKGLISPVIICNFYDPSVEWFWQHFSACRAL